MISGFVMVVSILKNPITPLHFIQKRLVRIAPAYWFFTLLTAIVVCASDQIIPLTSLESGFLIKSLLFIPDANPSGIGIFPLLTVGWSLNFEMIFYVVIAFSLLLPKHYLLLGIALGIIFVEVLIPKLGGNFIFYTNKIIFEFLLGVAVGVGYSKNWLQGGGLLLASAATIVAMLYLALQGQGHHYLHVGIPCVVIVIAALSQEHRFSSHSLVGTLGAWSYSTYLCHVMVLSIAYQATLSYHLEPYSVLCITCVVIVVLSWLAFTFIESKLASFLNQKIEICFSSAKSSESLIKS